MVVLRVVPSEIPPEKLPDGSFIPVRKPARIGLCPLEAAEERLNERVVVRSPRSAERLRQPQIREHLLDLLGLHLDAPVIDDDRRTLDADR